MSFLLSNRANRLRWAVWAPFYDAVVTFAPQRCASVDALALRPGERVLIPGCGTGADFPFLPAGVSVSAADLSPAMLSRARQRAAALRLDIDLHVADATHLDYSAESFDAVILHLILTIVDDPIACLREAERVLKPGGRIAVFDKFMPDNRPPSRFRRAVNALTRFAATDINRDLSQLLAATSLVRVSDRPALLGGVFRIAELRKPS